MFILDRNPLGGYVTVCDGCYILIPLELNTLLIFKDDLCEYCEAKLNENKTRGERLRRARSAR